MPFLDPRFSLYPTSFSLSKPLCLGSPLCDIALLPFLIGLSTNPMANSCFISNMAVPRQKFLRWFPSSHSPCSPPLILLSSNLLLTPTSQAMVPESFHPPYCALFAPLAPQYCSLLFFFVIIPTMSLWIPVAQLHGTTSRRPTSWRLWLSNPVRKP